MEPMQALVPTIFQDSRSAALPPSSLQELLPAPAVGLVDSKQESTTTLSPFSDSEVELSEPWGLPELSDDAEVEKLLEPILRDILGLNAAGSKGKGKSQAGANCSGVRWWTRPQMPLLCPLTRFPICLLPYPPFKLRVDPKRSSPHRLVDGKFLAMQIIVTGRFVACGRELQSSDISALDDHIHRCKLGPHRPGRVAILAREAVEAESVDQRARAAEELEHCVSAAKAELGKLRRIQENRLIQIRKALGAQAAGIMKPERSMSSISNASTSLPGTPDIRGRHSICSNLSTYSRESTPPFGAERIAL